MPLCKRLAEEKARDPNLEHFKTLTWTARPVAVGATLGPRTRIFARRAPRIIDAEIGQFIKNIYRKFALLNYFNWLYHLFSCQILVTKIQQLIAGEFEQIRELRLDVRMQFSRIPSTWIQSVLIQSVRFRTSESEAFFVEFLKGL